MKKIIYWVKAIILESKSYTPTYPSVFRIVFWSLLFLGILCGRTHTPNKVQFTKVNESQQQIMMLTKRNDKRWIRRDINHFSHNDKKEVNIAWLTGSSVIRKVPTKYRLHFLTTDVESLTEKNINRNVTSYVYTHTGRRSIGTSIMVQDAIKRKPDVIVLIINPFWVYNTMSLFSNQQHELYRGSELWWNQQDWPFQFTLVDPAMHFTSYISRYFPVFSSRTALHKELAFDPLKKLNTYRKRKEGIELKAPLNFWLLFGKYKGNVKKFYPNGSTPDAKAFQVASLAQANTQPGTLSDKVLLRSLEQLKDSGIPSLIYIAPISSEIKDISALSGYKRVIQRMSKIQSIYEGKHMKFIINLPENIHKSLEYRDYLHLSSFGLFPEYLSKNIVELVD